MPTKHEKKLHITAISLFLASALFFFAAANSALAQFDEVDDLAAEQAKEKIELEKMKQEMRSIKNEVQGAMQSMTNLTDMANAAAHGQAPGQVQEFHLFAREAQLDLGGGLKANCLTYNGQIPGPDVHLVEGVPAKIVLHNELSQPTSLHFHGLVLPQSVDGLPRAGALEKDIKPERYLRPKESFVYQFVPQSHTTAYYHPQVMHLAQRSNGMYGALIVHPRLPTRGVGLEQALFIGQVQAEQEKNKPPRMVYVVNGKTAPHIPALEVTPGKKVRLHIYNTTEQSVPLHLSGHKFEIISQDGSDPLEPHRLRDTVVIEGGSRVDLDFLADNPGVWSLASERVSQITDQGKFPAGIAIVLRYKK